MSVTRVRWSRPGPIVRLAAVPASVGFGQTAFLSLIPVIAMQTGLGLGAIGTAAAAGTLAFLVGAPLWGRRAERIGRRRLLIGLATAVFAGHLLLLGGMTAGASDVTTAFLFLVGARLLYGAGASGLIPTAQAWATDLAPPERKTGALGLLSAFGGLGRVVGAATASLALVTPFAPFVALAASPVLVLLAPADQRKANAAAAGSAARLSLFDRRLAPALVAGFLLTLGATQSQIALGPYLAMQLGLGPERAAAQVGVLLALAAITMIIVQGVIAARSPGRPEALLVIGAGGVISGALLFAAAGSTSGFAVAAVVLAIGFALAGPGAAAWLGTHLPSHERGAAFGWLASAQVSGQAAGALSGGLAFEVGPTLPFFFTALAGVAVGGLAVTLLVRGAGPVPESLRALPPPLSNKN